MSHPAGRSGVQRHIQIFLRALAAGGRQPTEQMTPPEARAVLEGLQSSVKVDLPRADVAERTIHTEGQAVRLVVVRPAGVDGHASGVHVLPWRRLGARRLSDPRTPRARPRGGIRRRRRIRRATSLARGAVPGRHQSGLRRDHVGRRPWPNEINVDGGRLAVVGNSVGGNMAAVVALMAKDRGRPDIRCQVLLWPVTERRLRHRLVRRIRRRPFPDPQHDEVVLGQLHHRPERAAGCLCLAPAGEHRAPERACRPRSSKPLRWTFCVTKAKRTRASWIMPASTSSHALQRPDPRLRPAQRDQPGSRRPLGAAPSVSGTHEAPSLAHATEPHHPRDAWLPD